MQSKPVASKRGDTALAGADHRADEVPSGDAAGQATLPPDARLAMLRLTEQARTIRRRIGEQRDDPGPVGRTWPWIRATLAVELETAFVHCLNALSALHELAFDERSVAPVSEIRKRVAAMAGCVEHALSLHRDVGAALAAGGPDRNAVLEIIETPLLQIAGFFDAMHRALLAPVEPKPGQSAEIEVALSIALDFRAQLSAAESGAVVRAH